VWATLARQLLSPPAPSAATLPGRPAATPEKAVPLWERPPLEPMQREALPRMAASRKAARPAGPKLHLPASPAPVERRSRRSVQALAERLGCRRRLEQWLREAAAPLQPQAARSPELMQSLYSLAQPAEPTRQLQTPQPRAPALAGASTAGSQRPPQAQQRGELQGLAGPPGAQQTAATAARRPPAPAEPAPLELAPASQQFAAVGGQAAALSLARRSPLAAAALAAAATAQLSLPEAAACRPLPVAAPDRPSSPATAASFPAAAIAAVAH
jgi:hypothetical protein